MTVAWLGGHSLRKHQSQRTCVLLRRAPGSEEIPVEREGTKERERKEMEMFQESCGMGAGQRKEEKEWVRREDMVSPDPQ